MYWNGSFCSGASIHFSLGRPSLVVYLMLAVMVSEIRILWKKNLSILSVFLSWEKLTQKKLSNFAELYFLDDNIYFFQNRPKLVFWSILSFKNSVLNAQQRFAFLCYSWNRVCRVPWFCCVKHPIGLLKMDMNIYFKKKPKAIWHLLICQNWCFGQFYHSRIEALQIAQLLALVVFELISLMRENLRGLRETL